MHHPGFEFVLNSTKRVEYCNAKKTTIFYNFYILYEMGNFNVMNQIDLFFFSMIIIERFLHPPDKTQ